MKTIEERKAILEIEIDKLLREGWTISSRTETGCQLVTKKKQSGCLIVVLFLFFIIPGIIYLILTSGTNSIYVEVNENGEINYSSKDLSPHELSKLSSQ